MAVLDTITVGSADYTIQDTVARSNAATALSTANEEKLYRQMPAAFFNNNPQTRSDNTYDSNFAKGWIFFWNSFNMTTRNAGWYPQGMLMITTKAVTQGTLIEPGVNCTQYPLTEYINTISTYVGSDGKLHFRNAWGADSALNFNGGNDGLNRPTNLVFHTMYGGGATFTYLDANPSPVTFKITYFDIINCQRARFGYLFNPNSQHNHSLEEFTYITTGTSITIPANTKCDLCLDCVGQNGGQVYIGILWS